MTKIKHLVDKSMCSEQELLLCRDQYKDITAEKSSESLKKVKQAFHNQGEKPGKLLAWRLKQLQTERAIISIWSI